MTSSSGSRPQGGSCVSIPRGRQRCTAARCSVPANWRPCGRSRRRRLGRVRRIEAGGSCLSAGKPKPARTPPRGLHRPRLEQRPRHGHLPARSDRAPAGAIPLTHFQRCARRLRRGQPRRRRGQEPALPTRPLPEHHRGLASHDEPHVAHRGAMVERARRLGVGGRQPLNLLQALPDHAAEPSVQSAVKRFLTHVNAAIERLKQFGEPSN